MKSAYDIRLAIKLFTFRDADTNTNNNHQARIRKITLSH